MKTLQLFLDELADMYDAEKRLVKGLPKMAKAATCPDLKKGCLEPFETNGNSREEAEQVFQVFDCTVGNLRCHAGLLEEADEMASEYKGSPAINAALISSAQRIEYDENCVLWLPA